jgi:hypothetical protein
MTAPALDAHLTGHGRSTPTEVDRVAGAATWIGSGLDGLEILDHLGAIPVGATHLWGWNDRSLFRARCTPDGGLVLAELTTAQAEPTEGRPIRASRSKVSLWGADQERLAANGQRSMAEVRIALPDGCSAVTTHDPSPVTFLAPAGHVTLV